MRVNNNSIQSNVGFGVRIGRVNKQGMMANEIDAIANATPDICANQTNFIVDIKKVYTELTDSYSPPSLVLKAYFPRTFFKKLTEPKEIIGTQRTSSYDQGMSSQGIKQLILTAIAQLQYKFEQHPVNIAKNKKAQAEAATIVETERLNAANKRLKTALSRQG